MKFAGLFSILMLSGSLLAQSSNALPMATVLQKHSARPLTFEPNRGQTDAQVRFISRRNGYALFLTENGAVLSLPSNPRTDGTKASALRIQFRGAAPNPNVIGIGELAGTSNYLIGSAPSHWRTNVPQYAKVKYEGLYPGTDLVFYGDEHALEGDFVVNPGANPNAIRLSIEGARTLRIDEKGDLVMATEGDALVLKRPLIYQIIKGARRLVRGGYVVRNGTEIGFRIAPYDHNRPLVIDPVIAYSTYLGGSNYDAAVRIAVDSAGNAYVVGITFSLDFPTANPLQGRSAGSHDADAFVAKLDPNGSALIYATYLGGNGFTDGAGIAVDSARGSGT